MLGLGLGTTQAQGLVDALAQVTNTKSVIFDGANEYISIPNLNITGACSFSLWIKPDTIHSYDVFFGSANNYIRIQADNGGKIAWDSVSDSNVFDLSTSLVQDQWNHLALTRDGSGNGIVYLNGSSVSTGSGISGTLDYDRIGQKNDEGYFGGNMDEIAVWTSQLSADEITQIYNSGTATLDLSTDSGDYSSSSNIKMWLRMGDEASTRVADGNANNLVIPDMRKTFFSGKSIDFDNSNDYVKAGIMNSGSSFTGTFAAWVYRETTDTGDFIYDGRGDSNGGAGYFRFLADDGASDDDKLDSQGSNTIYVDGVATTTCSAGAWHHVVVAGQTIEIDEDIKIGSSKSGASNFSGKICDVAIWDTTLDAATVASIYNSGEPNDLTLAASYTAGSGVDKSGDLQGYWRMGSASDDSHPTIQDQTSNNNDGTMTNMSEYDIVDHAPNRNSGDMINFDATSDIETDTP